MQKNVLTFFFNKDTQLDTPSKIIVAALEEFGQSPPKAVRTRDIAARAGVNLAAINYYFKGKEELYLELINQIVGFLDFAEKDLLDEFEILQKKPSKPDAIKLIKKALMMRCKYATTDIFKNIISIIVREELFNTDAFEILYTRLFEPRYNMLARLVEMASQGKCKGARAKILSKMIFGQIDPFAAATDGMKRSLGWDTFGDNEYLQVSKEVDIIIDKMFEQ